MPQMNPMNWLTIFLMMSLSFFSISSNMFYSASSYKFMMNKTNKENPLKFKW